MPEKKKTKTTASKSTPKTRIPKAASSAKTRRARTTKVSVEKSSRAVSGRPKTTTAKRLAPGKSPASTKPETMTWRKPPRKGETQMVAFIRDPHCIFTYWEVTPERIEAVKRELQEEYKDSSMVLRLFRTTPDGQAELLQEIRVGHGDMNRYVQIKDGPGSYFIEIAQKTSSGRLVVYTRSNRIVTGVSLEPGAAPALPDETPLGLQEYFTELEGPETTVPLRGLSSAEAHRKALQKRNLGPGRYSASRMG